MLRAINSAAGDGTTPSYGWHALYTRHQHEKVVASVLAHKGVETFLPLYTAAHRWKDRTKQLSLPLFPCYVFVRDGLDRQLQIMTTPGVFSWVGGSRPVQIPETDMEALFKMVASPFRVEPHPFLKCGDWVRVRFGPLEGIEGILLRKKNLFRLVLSVEMLQKSVAVEVDISMVERAARQDSRNCMPGVASEVSGRSSRAFAV